MKDTKLETGDIIILCGDGDLKDKPVTDIKFNNIGHVKSIDHRNYPQIARNIITSDAERCYEGFDQPKLGIDENYADIYYVVKLVAIYKPVINVTHSASLKKLKEKPTNDSTKTSS